MSIFGEKNMNIITDENKPLGKNYGEFFFAIHFR